MDTQSTDMITPAIPVSAPVADLISEEVREEATRRRVAQYLPQVIDLTREIYGGFTDVFVSTDPENPEDSNIVFRVQVRCSIEEALDMDLAWGRRLRQIIPRYPRVYIPSREFVT
jgi:hypothetical protein